MDISFKVNNEKFNYRVCAMIISDNKILAMHDERSPYFYLPGGRVELGETAEHACKKVIIHMILNGWSLNVLKKNTSIRCF